MKRLFFLFLMLSFAAVAQESGTRFEQGLSWAQAKEKAKKENKYLFVDTYTTWCIPCKVMKNQVFPQQKVGDFFNKNFVTIEVQMDKTAKDNAEIKGWYADAASIAEKYKIKAYPTYLIFSPDGELVHQIVGFHLADEFIAAANRALKPETQYFPLFKKYQAGEKDPAILKALASTEDDAGDKGIVDKVVTEYIASQKDFYTKENLEFLERLTKSSKSKGFEVILKNSDRVDAVLGKGRANDILSLVIMGEEVYPLAYGKPEPYIDKLEAKMKQKYPSVDLAKGFVLFKIEWYQYTKKSSAIHTAVLSYMHKYGNEADVNTLNSLAWGVFQNCQDQACVAEALKWSKRSIEGTKSENPGFIDTYANLLHKSGNTGEAIKWEEKAISLASKDKKADFQATLDKMKKGEKTW